MEIRYAVASQDSRDNEWKDEDMGTVRVATMVVSAMRLSLVSTSYTMGS